MRIVAPLTTFSIDPAGRGRGLEPPGRRGSAEPQLALADELCAQAVQAIGVAAEGRTALEPGHDPAEGARQGRGQFAST